MNLGPIYNDLDATLNIKKEKFCFEIPEGFPNKISFSSTIRKFMMKLFKIK